MALQFTLNRDPAASAGFDCVVVGAFADKTLTPAGQAIDAASGGRLAALLERGDLSGRSGKAVLFGNFPSEVKADIDIALGFADDDHRLDDLGDGMEITDEVGEARHVDEVDLVVVPLDGQDGRAEADLAAYFERVVVALAGSTIDRPHSVRCTGGEEQVLDEHRLARPAVAYNGDVSNLIGWVLFQILFRSVAGI